MLAFFEHDSNSKKSPFLVINININQDLIFVVFKSLSSLSLQEFNKHDMQHAQSHRYVPLSRYIVSYVLSVFGVSSNSALHVWRLHIGNIGSVLLVALNKLWVLSKII